MLYRAVKACIDSDGRFFEKGEEAILDPLLPHSDFLIPVNTDRESSAPYKKVTKGKAAKDVSGAGMCSRDAGAV